MISAGDFRNGITLEIEGQVVQILEFQHVKPGKGAAFAEPTGAHSSQPTQEQWDEAIAASEAALEAVKNEK